MPGIDLNNSDTIHKKNFSNDSFKMIFTNRKNDQGQTYKSRTKKIPVFKDQFSPKQKQFKYANIHTQSITKPGLP